MDVRQLSYFLKVAEKGSYTAASKDLYISQPGLFKGIRNLEEELGVRLFVQHNRKTTLSPAGQALYPKFKQIVELFDKVHDIAATFTENDVNTINTGIFTTTPDYNFPEGIRTFLLEEPSVTVNMSFFQACDIRKLLLARELDVALVPFYENEDRSGLELIPLVEHKACCIVHKDHPLAQNGTVSIKFNALQDQTLVLTQRSSNISKHVIETINYYWKNSSHKPQFVYAETNELLFAYLHNSSAVCITSRHGTLSSELHDPDLVELQLSDINFPHMVAYAKKADENISPQLAHLWDILKVEAKRFRNNTNITI